MGVGVGVGREYGGGVRKVFEPDVAAVAASVLRHDVTDGEHQRVRAALDLGPEAQAYLAAAALPRDRVVR